MPPAADSQFIEVRLLPEFPPEPINWGALTSAWSITLLLVGLSYRGWAAYVKPRWTETLDAPRYLLVRVLLLLFTIIVSVFSLQPILYLLINENQ